MQKETERGKDKGKTEATIETVIVRKKNRQKRQ